ncbi:MAG: AraC family transcriptional regulator [Planctomycetota bacterium]
MPQATSLSDHEASGSYGSYADWARQAHKRHEVIEQRVSDCGASLTRSRLSESFGDPATDDLKLFMVVSGEAPPTIGDVGFGKFKCRVSPGRFAVAGAGISTEFDGPGPYSLLALSLPWQTLRSDLEGLLDADASHLPPEIHRTNPCDRLVSETLRRMWTAIPSCSSFDDRLRFDGLVNVLVHKLFKLGGLDFQFARRAPVLTPSRLARVLEYVETTLHVGISLDCLAYQAGCSRFHFSRLFKNSVGTSPMAYVARRRLEQAKESLKREPEVPLAQLASRLGYSDQSHLIRQFRRQFGETPKRWAESV